ncbi:hypothetical protein H671_5g14881 [Cricetulus griseus]|uniref:Uncharacterized protein n=1 Tax=Cricetulus griseus TaxID=10029 RepID=A0A061I3F5_CRIGR|nr:hypothetical protein H671_5g14881 [Cricetulus griseus]
MTLSLKLRLGVLIIMCQEDLFLWSSLFDVLRGMALEAFFCLALIRDHGRCWQHVEYHPELPLVSERVTGNFGDPRIRTHNPLSISVFPALPPACGGLRCQNSVRFNLPLFKLRIFGIHSSACWLQSGKENQWGLGEKEDSGNCSRDAVAM